jgi:hypothetical protein
MSIFCEGGILGTLNRRTFVQLSSGALLTAASRRLLGSTEAPSVSTQDGFVRVKGSNYSWEYSKADDTFSLRDSRNRLVVRGTLQPAVVVSPVQEPSLQKCSPGKTAGHQVEPDRVTFQ